METLFQVPVTFTVRTVQMQPPLSDTELVTGASVSGSGCVEGFQLDLNEL